MGCKSILKQNLDNDLIVNKINTCKEEVKRKQSTTKDNSASDISLKLIRRNPSSFNFDHENSEYDDNIIGNTIKSIQSINKKRLIIEVNYSNLIGGGCIQAKIRGQSSNWS